MLRVIYLVFNEGYAASTGDALIRRDLTREAIRLGRVLAELLPGESEVLGLTALMMLHDSRRHAPGSPDGDLVMLEDQDHSLWDCELSIDGTAMVEQALKTRRIGPYSLQSAIAAVHGEAA